MELPPGITLSGFVLPEGTMLVGEQGGFSFLYSSPLNGFSPGYNYLGTVRLFAFSWCASNGGTLVDAPIRIVPHGQSGEIQMDCLPRPDLRQMLGLSSILCPQAVGTESATWGAIKSMFE
jgi:hypothetical protein